VREILPKAGQSQVDAAGLRRLVRAAYRNLLSTTR